MPALEDFAVYLRRVGLNPTTVEAMRDAIYGLINEQVAGADNRQKALSGLQWECKHLVDGEARNQARTLGPAADALSVPQRTQVRQALSQILTIYYNEAIDIVRDAGTVRVADYAHGLQRDANGGWKCTITIDGDAWNQLTARGGNPEQILNILAADPLDIRNSGGFRGRRCIKPEPYGWIFSTSSAVRLVDPDTSTTIWPPLTLNFTQVETGH